MYHDEIHHLGRPHFHASYAGDEASVDIETVALIAGGLPPRAVRLVSEWAKQHQAQCARTGSWPVDTNRFTRSTRSGKATTIGLHRIAAYIDLTLGELLVLRWEDVNLTDRRLVVHRAFSAGIEGPTKSWQARFVPISDDAATAFARLQGRDHLTTPTDFVFCSRLGRPLDGAVLRRRFKRTAAACLRVLRFHALRHGAGSFVARQADPRWVRGFLRHSKITTTERYMHAKGGSSR